MLSNHQFGFRKQHSTIHPLTLFINKISETLNNKEHALAIFCDLRKAFDTIDHSILLKKLQMLGILNKELLWFQDYLTCRKQFVQIDGVNSFIRNIKIGVPQGSILGPLLFLIYINDLPTVTSLFTSLFADDTKLIATNPDLVSLYNYANTEFQKVVYYFRAHKLSLHPSKTKFILFSHSRDANSIDQKICINNNNLNSNDNNLLIPIERITSNSQTPAIKFLGIFIDPALNFKYHITYLSTKISKALYFIRNSKNVISQKGLKSLYYSLVHCHLVYANIIWSSVKQSNLKGLIQKQKSAVRLIYSAPYNAHTEPIFKSLNILPLQKLCTYFRLQFFQQFKQGFLPPAFNNIWIKNSERTRFRDNPYTLRNSEDMQIFSSRLSQFETFPLYNIPIVWTSYQNENVKILRNIPEFNFQLKKSLLDELSSIYVCTRLLCPHCHLNNP